MSERDGDLINKPRDTREGMVKSRLGQLLLIQKRSPCYLHPKIAGTRSQGSRVLRFLVFSDSRGDNVTKRTT